MSLNHGGFALTVIGDKGTTLVNRGTGFSPVTGTTELKPGDRILVRNGAGARITYPDGCNVPVRGVATVDPLSPCNFMAADLPSRKAPPAEPMVAEEAFPILAVGGAGLGRAGIGGAVALTSHHNNNCTTTIVPLSPGSSRSASDILYSEGALDMSAPSERFAVPRFVAKLGISLKLLCGNLFRNLRTHLWAEQVKSGTAACQSAIPSPTKCQATGLIDEARIAPRARLEIPPDIELALREAVNPIPPRTTWS